ncbi:MAG: lactate utilization protein [Deltaproteobacteria bacterium]|jgi:hypothetical protein|nr:lactate utilization protein [Deltaproteobacteria bacterium]
MNDVMSWQHETLGKRAVAALEKNHFTAVYFPDRQSAVTHILSLVPEGASVGIGGSQTERALGLAVKLEQQGCIIHDHGRPDLTPEERDAARLKQLCADVFISSSNAVTLTGELVNRDGTGNRVAAMIFGPKKVIVVAGTNKIVRDPAEAETRIQRIASPLNNKRLSRPNPCVQTGECMDCHGRARICNITTIISRCPPLTDIHVFIIGEELGY